MSIPTYSYKFCATIRCTPHTAFGGRLLIFGVGNFYYRTFLVIFTVTRGSGRNYCTNGEIFALVVLSGTPFIWIHVQHMLDNLSAHFGVANRDKQV